MMLSPENIAPLVHTVLNGATADRPVAFLQLLNLVIDRNGDEDKVSAGVAAENYLFMLTPAGKQALDTEREAGFKAAA